MPGMGPVKPVRKPKPFKAATKAPSKPVRKVTPVARTKSAPAKPLTAEGKKNMMYQMDSFAKRSKATNNLKKQAGALKKQVANKQMIDMKKTIDKKAASAKMKKQIIKKLGK
jgi:hypothetical protein